MPHCGKQSPLGGDGVRSGRLRQAFDGDDEAALAARLRRMRTRVFIHTMLRDLMGLAPLTEVCGAMTTLADLALQETLRVHAARSTPCTARPSARKRGRRNG
jgi:glutamine synthetase adenylyltransferase